MKALKHLVLAVALAGFGTAAFAASAPAKHKAHHASKASVVQQAQAKKASHASKASAAQKAQAKKASHVASKASAVK